MAKNITILEGSTSKSFSNVNKLRVNNIGSGTSDWVPEDEVQLTTKHISENGTYAASDDGYYGYSEVTVNGVGSVSYTASEGDTIGGVELTEGNEYDISTDPLTGDVVVESLPSYIAIGHQPDKTSYIDGEEIDTDGLVVYAYTADGEIWINDNYPSGIVPIGEISIVPTTADIEAVSETTWASDDGISCVVLTPTEVPIPPGVIDYYRWSYGTVGVNGSDVTMVTTANLGAIYLTTYNDAMYIRTVNESSAVSCSIALGSINGSLMFAAHVSSSWSTPYSSIGSTWLNAIPVSTIDPTQSSGELHKVGGTQEIAVNWNRPSDGNMLSTSFEIRVDSETTSESSGESSGESGTGGGHSF